MTQTLQSIKLGDIVIDDDIDFRTDKEAGLDELAASIQSFGLMQPITVAAPNGDGKYHVVAGRRRYRAHEMLQMSTITCIVDDELGDEQARVVGQIIENLQREDVGPLDEARAFARLGDYGMKQKDVAAALGVSTSHVSGRLALLKLPETLAEKVINGSISSGLATKIARLPKAVRDELATHTLVDERSIARIEADQKDKADRQALTDALIEAGVPAGFAADGWGFVPADKAAELAGLTDEDKPKSHEWTTSGYEHRSHHEDDESFVAAVVASGAKGGWVTGAGRNVRVMTITSANLDKERKAQQEEQRQRAEQLAEERQRKDQAFEDAIAPIVAAPDKAVLVAGVLTAFLRQQLSGYGNVLRTVLTTAERMGWTLSQPDLSGGEGGSGATEIDHYRNQVLALAVKDTTTLMRTIVASQGSITRLLIEQGILANDDLVASLDVHTQVSLVEDGDLAEERVSEEARLELARQRALDAEEDDLQGRIDAEVQRRLDEHLDTLGPDDDELTDEELDAMREEIRAVVEVDLDPGL